jgi:two-component system, sensor histidine kinase and response regulator
VKMRKTSRPKKAAVSRGSKERSRPGAFAAAKTFHRQALHSLADLANEIRSPLNNLQAVNRSLLETNLSPEQREVTEKSFASAHSLLTLVNDLLDYSRVEGGRLALARMNFDLRTTLEDTAQLLAARAREKGLELGLLVHHEVPSLLSGDPGRLRQVLINFTHLALQHTEKGEILIQVTLEKESGTRAAVHIAVIHTGPRISPARQARLFEFPPRPGAFGKGRWGGMEVGLALSQKLVEKMGGKIGVDSGKNHGSTIWFTSVFRKQKASGGTSRISPQSLQGQRVLIVDEQPGSRQALQEQLHDWGCLPEAAEGGREALVKLCQGVEDQTPYSLAVLSKEMEEMDGITLAQEIRRAPALSGTLLVLLTSQGNRGEGKLMQDMGVAAYLTKPVKSSQLRDCLTLAVSRKKSPEEFAGAPLITRYFLAEEKKRRIRVLIASNDMHVQKVALQTLQKIGYGADVVPRGNEVLAALAKSSCDLVLMDTDLPQVDGLAAAIRRKEKQTGQHVPIVGMTSQALGKDRQRCLEAGMDDYMIKPLQAIDLADVLDRFLSETD